jgi:hypothetical protein
MSDSNMEFLYFFEDKLSMSNYIPINHVNLNNRFIHLV